MALCRMPTYDPTSRPTATTTNNWNKLVFDLNRQLLHLFQISTLLVHNGTVAEV